MGMNTEIEAKFLHINHNKIRQKLIDAGFVCTAPMRLMFRAIIDYGDRRLQVGKPNSYIRVRNEGKKITLTYKRLIHYQLMGLKKLR